MSDSYPWHLFALAAPFIAKVVSDLLIDWLEWREEQR